MHICPSSLDTGTRLITSYSSSNYTRSPASCFYFNDGVSVWVAQAFVKSRSDLINPGQPRPKRRHWNKNMTLVNVCICLKIMMSRQELALNPSKFAQNCNVSSQVILWTELRGKPKWRPLYFGYLDLKLTAPIGWVMQPANHTRCST